MGLGQASDSPAACSKAGIDAFALDFLKAHAPENDVEFFSLKSEGLRLVVPMALEFIDQGLGSRSFDRPNLTLFDEMP